MNIFDTWSAAFPAASVARGFTDEVPRLSKGADEIHATAAGFCKRASNSGHEQYIDNHGNDMPEIRIWKWSNPK